MPGRVATFREASFSGAGIAPRHFGRILTALWENRRDLPYAWKILNHGVCDGCSIGSHGLRDPLEGMHLCNARLQSLGQNTMAPMTLTVLGDVERLRSRGPAWLRARGRLAFPMIRRKGQRGFLRVSWEEAIEVIAQEVRRATPKQLGFLAAGHARTNEVYYVFQKLARVLGTNNLDLCSGFSSSDRSTTLKRCFGFDASTCSLSDIIGTDLLVSFGSDQPQLQELLSGYLHRAKKAGTRLMTVHPVAGNVPASGSLEHGDSLRLLPGGQGAFIAGVLKFVMLAERVVLPFIEKHTEGFAELAAEIGKLSWNQLEQRSGVAREAMQRFAEIYSRAQSAVFVCGPNTGAKDSLGAIVNLALARGMIGREKCGILVIRAGSGEQGALECGVAPDAFPGGYDMREEAARRFSNLWHHPAPSQAGLGASEILRAAAEGRVKFLYMLGCNSLASSSGAELTEAALSRVPVRVHQDTLLNACMLLDPAEIVVLLPGQTRYEQRTGGITTGTDRTIRFTPEIPGRSTGDTRPDWEIPILIGRRVMSNGEKLFPFAGTQSIREEMSRIMPIYQGVEQLMQEEDELRWGGAQLYKDGFANMPHGRARFA